MDGSTIGLQQALFTQTAGRCDVDAAIFDCRSVIEEFEELPESVRTAQIARIDGRPLDRGLFTELISQPPPLNCETGWSTRILKREESLMPYLGKILFCALIRLPGVQYTVEVDPVAKAVVHWEWHAV